MQEDNQADNLAIEPEVLFYGKQEQDDTVIPDVVAVEEPAEEEQTEEALNESEEESATDADGDTEEAKDPDTLDEDRVVDIDGRILTIQQIKDWENGSLRQSHFTKVTQKLADDRREFEAGKDEAVSKIVSEKFSALDSTILELEALIATNDEDLEGLDEYDPEYIDNEKLKAKRQKALESAKTEKSKAEEQKSLDHAAAVQSELLSNHPEWLDDTGAQTKVFKAELKTLSEYFAKNGWTEQDQKDIKSARVWEAVIVAAKNEKLTGKAKEANKTVRKLPITTRPRKTVSSTPKSDEELFYGSK